MKQILILIGMTLAFVQFLTAGDGRAGELTHKEAIMKARGTFDVKVTPQQSQGGETDRPFGRLFLDKQFHGDLTATSKGEMMAAETAVAGSGGYVALELVRGELNGKRGSFILQHKGTMSKGAYAMHITVVPDSGAEELAGIAGAMKIIIEGNKHFYEFEYTLVTSP